MVRQVVTVTDCLLKYLIDREGWKAGPIYILG